MAPLFSRLFLVPTAVGSQNDTQHTNPRSRTHTQKHRSWLSQTFHCISFEMNYHFSLRRWAGALRAQQYEHRGTGRRFSFLTNVGRGSTGTAVRTPRHWPPLLVSYHDASTREFPRPAAWSVLYHRQSRQPKLPMVLSHTDILPVSS